jgi:hypothetical protein
MASFPSPGSSSSEQPPTDTGSSDAALRFRAAWMGRQDPSTANVELLPVRLARAAAEVLGVDGAGLSLYEHDFRVPLGASDDLATSAERLQFTQGEGPCLDAARDHRVLVADGAVLEARWPSYADALFQRTPYRAIVTMPLTINSGAFGALDLFLVDPGRASTIGLAEASTVADQIVDALSIAQVIADPDTVEGEDPSPVWLHTPIAQDRTFVWVAMGMVMVRMNIPADDALALLRSYAYGRDALLDDVAAAVVDGSLPVGEMLP